MHEINSTSYDDGICSLSNFHRVWTYVGLILSIVILNSLRGILFYFTCVNASRVLHNRMFASVLRAPVLFFDNNPSGMQNNCIIQQYYKIAEFE